jgi:hypothetical protein
MKFNKNLDRIKQKYEYIIPQEHWFEYKRCKKLLKEILKIINNDPYNNTSLDSEDCCCICLESNNLMRTYCCKAYIHHTCLLQVLISHIPACPMCRADIPKIISYDINNPRQILDAKILSLLSIIQLNINKIEQIYNSKIIKNSKLLAKYKTFNYTAVIKISKKIDKHLHMNIKTFFTNVMKKHNVLVAEQEKTFTHCLCKICDIFTIKK